MQSNATCLNGVTTAYVTKDYGSVIHFFRKNKSVFCFISKCKLSSLSIIFNKTKGLVKGNFFSVVVIKAMITIGTVNALQDRLCKCLSHADLLHQLGENRLSETTYLAGWRMGRQPYTLCKCI